MQSLRELVATFPDFLPLAGVSALKLPKQPRIAEFPATSLTPTLKR